MSVPLQDNSSVLSVFKIEVELASGRIDSNGEYYVNELPQSHQALVPIDVFEKSNRSPMLGFCQLSSLLRIPRALSGFNTNGAASSSLLSISTQRFGVA